MENKKISKKEFEIHLIDILGNKDLTSSKTSNYDYDECKKITINLYYYKGTHVGSWIHGKGTVFEFVNSPKELEKRLNQLLDIKKHLSDLK